MGKPFDYTGEVIGRLTVIGLDHRGLYGGRQVNFWTCLCECGRREVISQTKLQKRRECSVCQRGPCVVCGGPIEDDRPMSVTCCEEHHLIHQRRKNNLFKAKQAAENPDIHRINHEQKMAAIKSDPKKHDAWLDKERKRAKERSNSHEKKERINELSRKRYHKNKDAIIARRRERWEQLTPEERQARLDRQRSQAQRWYQKNKEQVRINNRARWDAMSNEEKLSVIQRFRVYWNKAARKKMAVIKNDPALYDAYLNQQRRYESRRATRRALEKLIADSQQLLKVKNESDKDD